MADLEEIMREYRRERREDPQCDYLEAAWRVATRKAWGRGERWVEFIQAVKREEGKRERPDA